MLLKIFKILWTVKLIVQKTTHFLTEIKSIKNIINFR